MPEQTATKTHGLSAAEFFTAKLSYEMSPYGLKGLLDQKTNNLQVIDVRTPESYAEAHLPTAINIPLKDLLGKLSTLPKNKTFVTYCGSITCQLAPKAALELAQKGFKVMELHGGIKEWQSYGFPVETDKKR